MTNDKLNRIFDHLNVYKQMTRVKLNFKGYIEILETIKLCANKWVVLNRIISVD